MKIIAHGHYSEKVDDIAPPLKELVKETTGEHVRRVGRFIQLALIGSSRCVQQRCLPVDTGVYLTSGRGDLEITLDVLTEMVERSQPPKPLSFINTVSNSACFYVSKHFGLKGRSNFVTRRHAPLESALQLAALDIEEGVVQTALVGSVDIVTEPLSHHRERLALSTDGLAADAAVGEGSHWFLLAADDYPEAALAKVYAVKTFSDKNSLDHWLAQQSFNDENTLRLFGQHIGSRDTEGQKSLPYWYDSHCGYSLGLWLDQSCDLSQPMKKLLHIDTDPCGRFNVVGLERV